jgi:hypothetical protein
LPGAPRDTAIDQGQLGSDQIRTIQKISFRLEKAAEITVGGRLKKGFVIMKLAFPKLVGHSRFAHHPGIHGLNAKRIQSMLTRGRQNKPPPRATGQTPQSRILKKLIPQTAKTVVAQLVESDPSPSKTGEQPVN